MTRLFCTDPGDIVSGWGEISLFLFSMHILKHGLQGRMISVDILIMFLRLLFFALLLLYET